jgi:amino acid transporter
VKQSPESPIVLQSGRDYGELKRGSLGLPSAMAMSLAYISPTIGVIFISALIASHAGAAAPLAFIVGTIAVAFMASTLAEFSKRIPSAGTFYTFIARSFGSPIGFVAGWLLLLAYTLQSPLNTNLFGSFVGGLVQQDFGLNIPWWIYSILVIAFVGALAWFSIHRSMALDLAFVVAEVTVVGILLILILIRGGASGQVPAAFSPASSPTGFSGLGLAFIFIIFAFFGFESSTTVAEEVRNPRRNLPLALVGSVVLTGVWFVIALYAIIVGYGQGHVTDLANASAPVTDLANRYIGGWYVTLVSLAAISANIAVLIAIHNANFRIIYALGRERMLPTMLGRTHPIYKTPSNAILAYSGLSLVMTLFFGLLWGPMAAFGNVGYFSSLAMLPIYIVTNVALFFFIRRNHPQEFSWVLHALFPALAIGAFGAALISSLYPFPAAPLNVFPFITVAWIAAGVIWMLVLRRRSPAQLDLVGRVIFQDVEPRDLGPDLEVPLIVEPNQS